MPSRAAPSRSTSISACAVGSRSRSTRLPPAAMMSPRVDQHRADRNLARCAGRSRLIEGAQSSRIARRRCVPYLVIAHGIPAPRQFQRIR